MKQYLLVFACTLSLVALTSTSIHAGEPTGKIGAMNPAMFKCVDEDGRVLYQPDPFSKITLERSIPADEAQWYPEEVDEYIAENSNVQRKTCENDIPIDFGFNTMDSEEFNHYLADIENDCDKRDGKLVPVEDTVIEGFVYEYHPSDPNNPAGEWFPVPSRDVMVEARGITFNIYWGTNEEGYYYFRNLGAGPIVLNLRLPPDAHPINPDVVIFSNGLGPNSEPEKENAWTVFLGFYRGDTAPPDPHQLRTPSGNFLPFPNLVDVEQLSQCGSPDFTDVATTVLVPLEPPDATADTPAMPDVGGTLPPSKSIFTTILATIVVIILPTAGLLRLRQKSK